MIIRELDVLTIRMEREKLAKDAKSTIQIFSLLEQAGIPAECISINIDWLAITFLQENRDRVPAFADAIAEQMPKVDFKVESDFTLLVIEDVEFNSRVIGMLLNILIYNKVKIRMVRQIKGNSKLTIGVENESRSKARDLLENYLSI